MKQPFTRNLIVLCAAALLCVLGIEAFTHAVDPYCARCGAVDLDKQTFNPYYIAAQNLKAQPNTQQIIVGSSHAEAVPAFWLAQKTRLKTLNLSVGGSNAYSKLGLVKVAHALTRLQSVVWVADYFEFLGTVSVTRFVDSPALREFLPSGALAYPRVEHLASYLDYKTFDAALQFPKRKKAFVPTIGGATDAQCARLQPSTVGPGLQQAIEFAYGNYTERILSGAFSDKAWEIFVREVRALPSIHFTILVGPYHPFFRERMQREKPRLYQAHLDWIAKLKSLESKSFKVLNFFNGLPSDTPGAEHWSDGDHYSCQAVQDMFLTVHD